MTVAPGVSSTWENDARNVELEPASCGMTMSEKAVLLTWVPELQRLASELGLQKIRMTLEPGCHHSAAWERAQNPWGMLDLSIYGSCPQL